SLNYPNRSIDDDWAHRLGMTSAKRPVAHLSFDAARIAPPAAAGDALLQDLIEHALMERFLLLRGE
ncbi:MAG TPA: hypothetical protein VHQ87_17605, partial [Rhizobacter sp.]|nr:hypothetical protein [Rhizobacter sp.]